MSNKPFTLQRTTPQLSRQRMTIKAFAYAEDMYAFLNKQSNNDWKESNHGLKAGVYAYAGGQWHNVKSLDASVLAHV
jgi:hypothetical protein